MYQSLKVFSLESRKTGRAFDLNDEYRRRLTSPASMVFPLEIEPFNIRKQEKTGERFPLFVMLLPELVMLSETIFNNSRTLGASFAELPEFAGAWLMRSLLIREMKSTNEIEGIASTKKELLEALTVKGAPHRSFAMKYQKMAEGRFRFLRTASDLRALYDELLGEEISEDRLPDGRVFRKEPVYIRNKNGTGLVHEGVRDEGEILRCMQELIDFMNREDIPVLIKTFTAHYYFEYVHPFYDGNGRIGRFLAASYLFHKLDPISAILLSQSIAERKSRYEKAFLEVGDPVNRGEATFFVMRLQALLREGQSEWMESLAGKTELYRHASERAGGLNLSAKGAGLLDYLLQAEIFDEVVSHRSYPQIREDLDISAFVLNQAVKELEEAGCVEKIDGRPIRLGIARKTSLF